MVNSSLRFFLWFSVLSEKSVEEEEDFILQVREDEKNSKGTVDNFAPDFIS